MEHSLGRRSIRLASRPRRILRNIPRLRNISDTDEMDSDDDVTSHSGGIAMSLTFTTSHSNQHTEAIPTPSRLHHRRRRILESTDEDDENLDTDSFTSEDEGRLGSEDFQISPNFESGSSDSDLTIISPVMESSNSEDSSESSASSFHSDNESVLSINIPHLESSVQLANVSHLPFVETNDSSMNPLQDTTNNEPATSTERTLINFTESVDESNISTIAQPFASTSLLNPTICSNNETVGKNQHEAFSDEKDEEGQICPICFEPWSNSGNHRLSSLKCGHIFGKTCIERWLRTSTAKCPQCNAKANKKDIRIIYAKSLKAVDTSEKDKLAKELEEFKRKCALLEKENAKMILKNELESQKLRKCQEEFKILKNSVSDNGLPSLDGIGQSFSCRRKFKLAFYMSFDLTKEGACRVMAYNEWMNMLVVSVPCQVTMFAGFGIKKINMLDMKCDKYIPLHQKQVRDLAFNPDRHDLLLSVAMDKCAKIINVTSNTIVNTYTATQPLWSCCWNDNNSSEFFVGSATGAVYHYDIKNTTEPINTYYINGSGPIVSLSFIPLNNQAEFQNSGLLVTRLNSISFVEFKSEGINEHDLPIEGPFVSTSFDLTSRHIFVTCRPTQKYAHARHIICQLHSSNSNPVTDVDQIISTFEIHSFKGGTTMKVLSRASLMPNPQEENEALALFSEESSLTTKIFDMRTASLVQMLRTNSNVIDIIPVNCQGNKYVALLTEKKVILYKWIEQL